MKKLVADPASFYTPKKRPSGHDIGASFGRDNGGAIPSNLLQIPNSESNGQYQSGCVAAGVKPHPARFPEKLPEFFIRMLTDPGDLVLDLFGGSNHGRRSRTRRTQVAQLRTRPRIRERFSLPLR